LIYGLLRIVAGCGGAAIRVFEDETEYKTE